MKAVKELLDKYYYRIEEEEQDNLLVVSKDAKALKETDPEQWLAKLRELEDKLQAIKARLDDEASPEQEEVPVP